MCKHLAYPANVFLLSFAYISIRRIAQFSVMHDWDLLQIAFVLKQVEDGTFVVEVCRKTGIAEGTFYAWLPVFSRSEIYLLLGI